MQIKLLLSAVRHFKLGSGDPVYTMGIVDMLLECIELSYRPAQLLSVFPCGILLEVCSLLNLIQFQVYSFFMKEP